MSHHTATDLDTRKIAFWTFIGSECLLFGTLISTYLIYEGRSIVGPTTREILNIPITSVSTFDLLMSSLAMVLALAAVSCAWGAAATLNRTVFVSLAAVLKGCARIISNS